MTNHDLTSSPEQLSDQGPPASNPALLERAQIGDPARLDLRLRLVRLILRVTAKWPARTDLPVTFLRGKVDARMRKSVRPVPGVSVTQTDLGGIRALQHTPADARDGSWLLYLHGGGYFFGSPETHQELVSWLAKASRCCCLSVDYRLAPEHPFPAAVDDAYAAYLALLARGADPQRIAIAGDSAGGGLALALLLRLRATGTPLPAAAALLSPLTDMTLRGESLYLHANSDPMGAVAVSLLCAALYMGGGDPMAPEASPVYADLTGLPPCLIQVGHDESLYSDSLRIAERLPAAGVPTRLETWAWTPHVWQMMARFLPQARDAITRLGTFIQAHTA